MITPTHKPSTTYAGADWLVNNVRDLQISDFGRQVADLLGDLYRGIYHIDISNLRKVEWGELNHIAISVYDQCGHWATTDGDLLTWLVVLAHDRCIRVSIEATTRRYLRLRFSQRQRAGDIGQSHPTLEVHAAVIRTEHPPREVSLDHPLAG